MHHGFVHIGILGLKKELNKKIKVPIFGQNPANMWARAPNFWQQSFVCLFVLSVVFEANSNV